ncbi:CDGSH iron-sulfur domain-containing mitochondrial [Brachionus plicatilis]|uniref:CDGSH iron-sulfur domain-containing mitochondrial n=1 Tax=Brachionus plicatilis TaxID=10195 RepID=A0A3M7QBZ3_BRAPC|nr:CDGSH iron-sulfur domain-containing mitochondrial [Brachionus plicatilis]
MNILIRKNTVIQDAAHSLKNYYQKQSIANRYRYQSRIVIKNLSYPPTLDGTEDYAISAKNEENDYIKKILNIRSHPEAPLFPDEYSLDGPPKGRIYEKMPFKFKVEKGKVYSFCTCGYSNNQPFCDSTHKMLWTTHLVKKQPKYRPIKYVADDTKDVWFCNCKQSNDRPFCDGTHKSEEVKKGISFK